MRSSTFVFISTLFVLAGYGLCVTKQVIVIGSGISGLSAADSLIKEGITDVMVVEARSRVGGRTHTVSFETSFIEMGAQWVHGSTNNPVYTFAKGLDLLDETTKTSFGDMNYATQDGEVVDKSYFDQTTEQIEDIFDGALQEADSLTISTDKTLQSVLDRRYADLLKSLNLDPSKTELFKAIYNARLFEEKVDEACSDFNELSTVGWNSFSDSGGDDLINLKSGYGSLVDYFKSRIGDKNILLNEAVVRIEYPDTTNSAGNPVKVTTANTVTGAQTVHEADYVLVTMPLGYLKAHYKTLFSPPLPTAKMNAIENLGFGTVNKIWLVFDAPPLPSDEQGFQVLWRNDRSISLDSAIRCGFSNYPFYKAIGSFEALPKMKNVLYGFMVGEEALFVEQISDQCLLDIVHEMLVKAFPEQTIPKPRSIMRSKWNSDEYAKGSYSFIKMNASTVDIENLATEINSRVFFAGEATSEKFISAVHGAYESGLREADKISELVLKNSGGLRRVHGALALLLFFLQTSL